MILRRDSLAGKLSRLPWFLLLLIIVIAVFGTAILFSAASSAHNLQTGLPDIHADLAINHAVRFVLFLAIGLACALAPLRLWAGMAYPVYFAGIVMLIMVDVGGVIVKGAERWLQVGPIRLQPSEFMKIAVPLALARWYHQRFETSGGAGFWSHIWALVIVGIPVALVMRQPDLGTALMILATGAAVIFFAGINLWIVGGTIATGIVVSVVSYFFILHDYQRQRVETLFNPDADPQGAGYQLQQALIAIGSGGFGGKGFMEGAQKELDYIPEQHTDFILTIVAEEFGFVGVMLVLVAWAIVLVQGMNISNRSGNAFGALASAGFVSTLLCYVVINTGMVIGLLPVVGIPMPLISYGGTVMLTVMVGFGLLMAVHLKGDQNMSLNGVL